MGARTDGLHDFLWQPSEGLWSWTKFSIFWVIFQQVRFNCNFQSSHQHRDPNISYLDESGIWSFVCWSDYLKYLLTFVTNWPKIGCLKPLKCSPSGLRTGSQPSVPAQNSRCARWYTAIEKMYHFFWLQLIFRIVCRILFGLIFRKGIMNWFIIYIKLKMKNNLGSQFSHIKSKLQIYSCASLWTAQFPARARDLGDSLHPMTSSANPPNLLRDLDFRDVSDLNVQCPLTPFQEGPF